MSSAFAREAMDQGAELFNWSELVQRSGRRTGPKVTGVGVALSSYSSGATGVDGLFVIRPDGRMYIQSGVGNPGTGSAFDTMPVRSCGRSRPVTWAERRATTRSRVYRRDNRSQGLSFARAAGRAIELGGRYDGHELPADIHRLTTSSATALAGQGLMGVAKDTFEQNGWRMSFVAGFAEVEVDTEIGDIRVVHYAA